MITTIFHLLIGLGFFGFSLYIYKLYKSLSGAIKESESGETNVAHAPKIFLYLYPDGFFD